MSEPRDDVGRLLRLAGKRAPVPEERSRRVRGVAHDAWRAAVRRRRIRLVVGAAGAIAAGMVVAILLLRGSPTDAPPPLVASVVGDLAGYAPGARAAWGASIDVPVSAGIALRMPSGHSLRIAAETQVVLRGPDLVELTTGKVYLDSGEAGAASAITVATPLADVVELGTRFEVAVEDAEIRVRVRDGEVSVRAGGERTEVRAGTELRLDRSGKVSTEPAPAFGPAWDWVVATAPRPDFDGRTVAELLSWSARERGWTLRYDDDATRRAAVGTVLHGDLTGLGFDERLDAALLASRLERRVTEGELRVSSRR